MTIPQPENAFALVVFVVVGVTVASVVDRSAIRARQAARGRAEAQLLAAAATSVIDPPIPVHAVLEQARIGFGDAVGACCSPPSARTRTGHRSGGLPSAGNAVIRDAGPAAGTVDPDAADVRSGRAAGLGWAARPVRPAAAAVRLAAGRGVRRAGRAGRRTGAADPAGRAGRSDSGRPTASAPPCWPRCRTTCAPRWPRSRRPCPACGTAPIAWTEDDQTELLAATDAAADQLDALLANLLDLSRLQTGVVRRCAGRVGGRGGAQRADRHPADRIRDDIPDDLPLIDTDAGPAGAGDRQHHRQRGAALPAGRRVRLLAGEVTDEQGRRVQIRVVDSGPGVPPADRDAMFAPFQRLGDVPEGSGVGLGLAVARGLAEAVDATIEVDDTPGGGLTMIVTVPVAAPRSGRWRRRRDAATTVRCRRQQRR